MTQQSHKFVNTATLKQTSVMLKSRQNFYPFWLETKSLSKAPVTKQNFPQHWPNPYTSCSGEVVDKQE